MATPSTGALCGPETWILEAGVQLLHAEGPRALTARRVARRAGVAVGTLYAHFSEMRTLRDAVYAKYRRGQHMGIGELCNPNRYPPVSGLAIALKRVVGAFVDAALAAQAVDPAGRIDRAELGEPATDEEVREMSRAVVRAMRASKQLRWRPRSEAAIDLLALGLPTAVRVLAYRDPARVASPQFREQLVTWVARYLLRGGAGDRVGWDWYTPDAGGWSARPAAPGRAARALRDPGDDDPSGDASVRGRLISAATRLQLERGRTPRAREVAEAAGVSPGSIYYHFGSLSALMRRAHDGRVRGGLERASDDQPDLARLPLRQAVGIITASRVRNASVDCRKRVRPGQDVPLAMDDPDFARTAREFAAWVLDTHADEVRPGGREDMITILTLGFEGLMRPFHLLAPERLLEPEMMRELTDWSVLFVVRDDCLGG